MSTGSADALADIGKYPTQLIVIETRHGGKVKLERVTLAHQAQLRCDPKCD